MGGQGKEGHGRVQGGFPGPSPPLGEELANQLLASFRFFSEAMEGEKGKGQGFCVLLAVCGEAERFPL